MMREEEANKLVILDRDGVINVESDEYVKSPEEWIPIDSSLRAIARLNQAGYKVAVATNQSGVSRGLFSEADLIMMHKKMDIALAKVGGHIDALEFCSDHPDQASPNRKPNPGMLNKHIKLFNASAEETWFVGDNKSDIDCAINAGCKPALVLTGDGKKTQKKSGLPDDLATFENLESFVESVIKT